MTQAQSPQKSMTFDQFMAWQPDESKRYELIDGEVRPMESTGDHSEVTNEPQWKSQATITTGHSVKLAVEVVSTNCRDDYLKKYSDYEALEIAEYWIVDYRALGGVRFIGSPKQPAISVYGLSLNTGEFNRIGQFRGSERIVSQVFPELNLTAEQVFADGGEG